MSDLQYVSSPITSPSAPGNASLATPTSPPPAIVTSSTSSTALAAATAARAAAAGAAFASSFSPTHSNFDFDMGRRGSVASTSSDASHSTLAHRMDASAAVRKPQRLRMLIIRHGETDHNVQGIIQGQLDTDLNDVGRRQARQVASALATEHIDEVYASPLRRARDTATAIVAAHPNHAYGRLAYWLDERLKERGFGVLEGHTFDRRKPKRDSIDGIEQMNVFAARLASFVSDVVVQPAPFSSDTGKSVTEWIDEPQADIDAKQQRTRLAQASGVRLPEASPVGPTPKLNKAGCTRTVAIVAHGAAISALVSAVLLDAGLACMSAGVQRTRVWNCSITEVIVEDYISLPRTQVGPSTFLNLEALAVRPGKKAFVIERWADVRHLPDDADDEAAAKGAADEMVGRTAA